MIDDVTQTVRKYTDGFFASFTKTAPDGRRVIYPWGAMGRGYFIGSDDVEERLKRLYSNALIVGTVGMGVASSLGGPIGGFGALVLLLVWFVVSVKRLTAGMEPSGEGLGLIQAYRDGARALSLRQLWSVLSLGVFLIAIGILLFVAGYPGSISPKLGMFPELVIFFGFGLLGVASGGGMLLLRRGADQPAEAASPAKSPVLAEEIGSQFTGQMGPIAAWLLTIFGLGLLGLGVYVLVRDSEDRSWEMASMVALFGLVAALGIVQLVLRHWERRG